MAPSPDDEKKYAWIKIAGQCSFIPIYLALFPIAFHYIGQQLDHFFGTDWLRVVFLFLGIFSGFRQTFLLIRDLIRSQEQNNGSS